MDILRDDAKLFKSTMDTARRIKLPTFVHASVPVQDGLAKLQDWVGLMQIDVQARQHSD